MPEWADLTEHRDLVVRFIAAIKVDPSYAIAIARAASDPRIGARVSSPSKGAS